LEPEFDETSSRFAARNLPVDKTQQNHANIPKMPMFFPVFSFLIPFPQNPYFHLYF